MKLNELCWDVIFKPQLNDSSVPLMSDSIDHIVPVDAVEVVECQSQ